MRVKKSACACGARGRYKLAAGGHEPIDRIGLEDDEEDDAGEDDDPDRCVAGDDGCGAFIFPYGFPANVGVHWGSWLEGNDTVAPIFGADQERPLTCELAATDTMFAANDA